MGGLTTLKAKDEIFNQKILTDYEGVLSAAIIWCPLAPLANNITAFVVFKKREFNLL
jgi:hypothetical protein